MARLVPNIDVLGAFGVLERLPLGRTAFSLAARAAAPYFLTIPAKVEVVEPGRAEVRMSFTPWVRNHLGTVHAIAMCNLAELAMGMAVEASVPSTHRWIPSGMDVEYRRKARTALRAVATVDLPSPLGDRTHIAVPVMITDADGEIVTSAAIRVLVAARAPSPRAVPSGSV